MALKSHSSRRPNNYHEVAEGASTFSELMQRLLDQCADGFLSELARQIGVTHPTVTKWIKDPENKPELRALKKFSDSTGLSFSYLVNLAYPEYASDFTIPHNDSPLAEVHRRLDSLPENDQAVLSQVILNYQPR